MKIKTLALGGAAALSLVLAGCANPDSSGAGLAAAKTAPADPSLAGAMAAGAGALPTPEYLTAAGQSDQFEIQEGQLAASKSQNPKVQQFGQMMVKDHTMTTQNLMAAVKKAGMTPPPPPPLRPDQQQMIAQLQGQSGAGFDRMYVMQQVQSHQEALQVQQSYAAGGSDPTLRGAAKDTVPIVQEHLNMAQQMQTMMGG